ncbi:MAG: sulfatase-like hydrolase/transferase, partial [Holophagales bacterium]|nr:sulfatase-like hydrolase/transferase [Holophagales bacterium]
VTSDHGEEFLDHGMIKHGHQLFDESLHVPLLIHAPGRLEPGRHGADVSLQGLFRAVLQLMGSGPRPEDDDLLRLPSGFPVFAQTRVAVAPDQPRERYTVASVRDGDSWLVRSFDDSETRLFDLATDPEQLLDVSARDPEEMQRLLTLLELWLEAEASGSIVEPPSHLDPESLERLRALGYIQ